MFDSLREAAAFLLPWDFSPAAFALCVGGAFIYVLGLRRLPPDERPSTGRRIAFFSGCALVYLVMQTRFDYFSQHMFFMHRIQHLVLHHLGPFLVALSAPTVVLARGVPRGFVQAAHRAWSHRSARLAVHAVQNVWVAPILFVGLIFFWLTPSIHFVAMLSAPWYAVMNWSMLLDGLLFWALVLDRRGLAEGAWVGFGPRIWMLLLAMLPQILLGSYISLSGREIFDIYGICGRAWDLDPVSDQTLGGLITWIPASMMQVLGALIVFSRWMRADRGREAMTTSPAANAVGG